MKIYEEKSLRNFEFWGGAKYVVSKLTFEELERLEHVLELAYPDGIDATTLNDIFAYDSDVIAEYCGYTSFGDLVESRSQQTEGKETSLCGVAAVKDETENVSAYMRVHIAAADGKENFLLDKNIIV